MHPFLVLGMFGTNCAHSGPFLAIFWPFLGHAVEIEGNKGLLSQGNKGACGV